MNTILVRYTDLRCKQTNSNCDRIDVIERVTNHDQYCLTISGPVDNLIIQFIVPRTE